MAGGRPPKYETPEEMQAIIELYYFAVKLNKMQPDEERYEELTEELSDEEKVIVAGIEENIPLVSGLAYTLGMSTEALRNYENKEEFLATVKRAKQRVEMSLEQRLAGQAVAGSIFSLKNNFGWRDKTETELSGGINLNSKSEKELDDIIAGK